MLTFFVRWLKKLPAASKAEEFSAFMLIVFGATGWFCGRDWSSTLSRVVAGVLGGLLLVLIGLKAAVLVLREMTRC